MASIHREKRGSKSRIRVKWRTIAGEQASRVVPDQATAKELERAIERARALGRDYEDPKPEPKPRGLDEVLADGLAELKRDLRPATVAIYEFAVGHFLDFVWLTEPHATASALTRRNLSGYWQYLRDQRGVNERTATNRVRCLETIWEMSAELANTDERREVPSPLKLRRLPKPPPDFRTAPTWVQMDAAIRAARAWYPDLLTVMRCTGLRLNQAMNLRRAWIDLEGGWMLVHGSVGKTVPERKGRRVPITPHLVGFLQRRFAEVDSEWVVETRSRARTPADEYIRQAWKDARVEVAEGQSVPVPSEVYAGKDKAHGSPSHAFRHGFISNLLAGGAPILLVKLLVGHRTGDVTLDHYADTGIIAPELWPIVNKIPPLPDQR